MSSCVHVGQTRINRHGFKYIVTAYNQSTNRFTVYFPETDATKEACPSRVTSNTVSERPLFKGPADSLKRRISTLYNSMRWRLAKHPSYADVKLDPRWETLAGFRETIHLVEGYELWATSTGYSLDKDIKGARTYGPDTCIFVTRGKNSSQPRSNKPDDPFYVGSVHAARDGQFEVIERIDGDLCRIRFLKTGFETMAKKDCMAKGTVKDRLHPSVCGIGYLGEEDFSKVPRYTGIKATWCGMIHNRVKAGKPIPPEDQCFATYFKKRLKL